MNISLSLNSSSAPRLSLTIHMMHQCTFKKLAVLLSTIENVVFFSCAAYVKGVPTEDESVEVRNAPAKKKGCQYDTYVL